MSYVILVPVYVKLYSGDVDLWRPGLLEQFRSPGFKYVYENFYG